MYDTWPHIGPSCLPWAIVDGWSPSMPEAPGTCPPRLHSPCAPCNRYYTGGYGRTPAMIPHRDRCPLGQFSCHENLLSQQTHVCYEPQWVCTRLLGLWASLVSCSVAHSREFLGQDLPQSRVCRQP